LSMNWDSGTGVPPGRAGVSPAFEGETPGKAGGTPAPLVGAESVVWGDAMHGALLGPEYRDEEIEAALRGKGAVYRRLSTDALLEAAVELLEAGKVLGWFQGRMEFGP